MELETVIAELRRLATALDIMDAPGASGVSIRALAAIESLQTNITLLREALALHHSMVLGSEKESSVSEECYKIAMESSR